MLNTLKAFAVTLSILFSTSFALGDEASKLKAQEIIRGQIEAFKAGDDALAYSFAAPSITQFFPDVAGFMEMVKRGYQPVYKPRNYDFGRSRDLGENQVAQEVLVTAPDGKPWTAIYTLMRLADGTWRINSVQLVPGDDSSA